jgi:hypothetical protein
VRHICNPNYFGGRNRRITVPDYAKVSETFSQKKKLGMVA